MNDGCADANTVMENVIWFGNQGSRQSENNNERSKETPSNVDVKGNDFELIPFGAGRRICAGMNLGIRMIHLVVATLVHGFNWALPDSQSPEKLNMEETFGLTLQRAEPLMVRPRARLANHAYRNVS
ncbi:hypothetical protein Scep_016995 [Stephania cephalantha]|uniref:Cytochrome P450 n=1 Tax=Stephania cephalantha TaxID=152367 RepID=A0AAP0INV0_9MAGN